tara:strand:+ start:727 stop:1128 length:402 start_codon:yes stop_codon:yes gene_type:complete
MKFKSVKTISILGLASFTLVSCGSNIEPQSIACDGYEYPTFVEETYKVVPLSYTADQEKVIAKLPTLNEQYETKIKDDSEIKLNKDGTAIIFIDNYGPKYGVNYDPLSLTSCPKKIDSAVQYFIAKPRGDSSY